MPCSRGCCDSPREHYRSIALGSIFGQTPPKRTVDDHGTHTVTVTESDDRQDVTVKPRHLTVKAGIHNKE